MCFFPATSNCFEQGKTEEKLLLCPI